MRLTFVFKFHQTTFLTALFVTACSATINAVDVNFYSVQKALKYNQSSASAPTPGAGNPYRFEAVVGPNVQGSVLGATVSASGIPAQDLSFDDNVQWFSFNAKFASQTALDSATPSGNYTLVINTLNQGQKTVTLNLPAETFPAAPHISNWTAAQSIDPTKDFTLKWDAFAGGTTNDFILVLMGDANTGVVALRSPDPFRAGALKGTSTSVVIPAGTLQPSATYQMEITFVKIKSQNTTSYPGAVGVVGFNSFTDTGLMTTTNPVSPVHFAFSLRQFAQGGSFLNSTNASPQFPVAINGYRAELIVTGTTNFAPSTQISFTGPPGSGLTNTSSGPNGFAQSGNAGLYFSPKINQPALAAASNYSVNYQGILTNFNFPDPQVASHLIVPVPKIFLSNGLVTRVNWQLYDPGGNALSATPPALSSIQVQELDSTGALVYNSEALAPSASSYTFTNALAWTNLASLRFLYEDNLGNSYIITYANVIVSTPVQLSALSYSSNGLVLQLTGAPGHGYRIQFSSDLTHWSDLTTTNLSNATVQLVDSQTATTAARFYRAVLAN